MRFFLERDYKRFLSAYISDNTTNPQENMCTMFDGINNKG